MGNSQVVELVQTLSKEERQLVQEFADQHFFNSGKQKHLVKPLLKILLSEKESKKKDAFSKEYLYRQLFGEAYKADQRLEKTMSEVQKFYAIPSFAYIIFAIPMTFFIIMIF